MQMSGGHLLAAGLDGGNTMIKSSPVIRTIANIVGLPICRSIMLGLLFDICHLLQVWQIALVLDIDHGI